jgi:sortase A
MKDERHFRQTLVLGSAIALFGIVCLGGGLVLLAWRLLKPADAVILPPGFESLISTPTPGVWGTPLAPPPLPDDPAQVVMLPPGEVLIPSLAPTQNYPPTSAASPTAYVSPSPTRSLTPGSTAAPLTPTPSPTRTHTAIPPTMPTSTPAPTPVPTALPGIPERILIDQIDLNAPIIPVGQHALTLGEHTYSQWDVPDFRAAGWHDSSARLGEVGNTVINGHHNIDGEVFRYLVALQPGAIITLESQQHRRYHYVIVQMMTLPEEDQPVETRRENARWILPTTDERVTLITCWPYYANTYRLVVIARPLSAVIPTDPIP